MGEPEAVCRLVLPLPPTTNNLFRSGPHGGRYKTKAYKAWLEAAGWEIKLQRPPALHPPLRTCLRVLIEAPLGANRDIDNALKPLLDVMTRMGVYVDDRLIDDLRIVRLKGGLQEGMKISDSSGKLDGWTITHVLSKCVVSIWPM